MRERVYDGFYKVDRVQTPEGVREVVEATDALSLLIICGETIILVRQPRASMISEENPEGLITETCAGRFDGAYDPLTLAQKEAEEETGIAVCREDIRLLNGGQPMAVSAGLTTERSYLAVVEVPGPLPSRKKVYGAAGEGERITRIEMPTWVIPRYLDGRCEDVRVFALLTWYWNWNQRRSGH